MSLAGAALTRPEGLLLAACCFGWFAVQSIVRAPRTAESSLPGADDTILRMLAAVVRRLDWRELTYLIAPFAVLVTAHFLFRYGYYGEWLPNTYYAKHVRPWYESGFRYLWAAALETGLYLLLPLTFVALRERWRRYRDGIYALVLLCISLHMYYLLRIGGDHFEYRPWTSTGRCWRFLLPRVSRTSGRGLRPVSSGCAGCPGEWGRVHGRLLSSCRCCSMPVGCRASYCSCSDPPGGTGTSNSTRRTLGGCWWRRGCQRWWPFPTTCAGSLPNSLFVYQPRYTAM